MIGSYLAIALRNIVRHKLYSFINIAGLTVGLTGGIFIILFVRDQLSYDRWIPGTENLYRVEETIKIPGKSPMQSAITPFVGAQAMLEQIPEVQARTRLERRASTILVGNRQFPQSVDFVDPNFLEIIRLPLAAGDPNSVLSKPESAVLSETTARRYFGDGSPIGKTIIISGQHCDAQTLACEATQQPLVVTGILRDLPHNTQLEAEVLIPNTSTAFPIDRKAPPNWFWSDGWAYVRLARGTDPNVVIEKFKTVIDHAADPMKAMNVKKRGSEVLTPYLTPFADAHLSTDRYHGITPPGSWTIVYGFSAIGALLLLIACFNFTNLATARAMMRAREISLRKVAGATRRQLIFQFLGEALITAMIALALALALTEMLSGVFDRVLGLPVAIHYSRDWQLLLMILSVGVAAGLLSGAYPALVLSALRPASIMRGNKGSCLGAGLTRAALVVLQFAVSIGLGIAAAVIFVQISFSRNVDLGFRKDAIVVMTIRNIPPGTVDSLARALRTNPDIADVATSGDIPFSGGHDHISVNGPGATSSENLIVVSASPDYIHLYDIKLLAGRELSDQRAADGLPLAQVLAGKPFNVLINAAAAGRFGYSPQGAIGKTLGLVGYLHNKVTIVGVASDTKQDGPKSVVEGTMYMYSRAQVLGDLSVRIRDGHTRAALAFIDRTWHTFAPSIAIQRHFLEDDYDRQFLADERQGKLFCVFVGIAIFIACLGLFGLAAFSTERRTQEIGLRKTFGADTGDIILLLLWQFSIPVLVANLIAWPIAWYYLHSWLQGFAYHIPLSPFYFIGAGAIAMVIAWATVFVHACRVAGANPIHALRYE
jgi:putative ABC transport system permease protein